MKKIMSLNDATEYASRLGFAKFQGTIQDCQDALCNAVDDMIEASGQKLYGFKPFEVKYNRNDNTFSAKVIA